MAAVEFEISKESEVIDKYRQDRLHELLWMKMQLKQETQRWRKQAPDEIREIVNAIDGPLILHCMQQADVVDDCW